MNEALQFTLQWVLVPVLTVIASIYASRMDWKKQKDVTDATAAEKWQAMLGDEIDRRQKDIKELNERVNRLRLALDEQRKVYAAFVLAYNKVVAGAWVLYFQLTGADMLPEYTPPEKEEDIL